MALIENPNDMQNMFSKAGKITSEKYIIFQRKEEILHNKPRYFKGKTLSEVTEKETVPYPNKSEKQLPKAVKDDKTDKIEVNPKFHQPFSKQQSRSEAQFIKMSHDEPPPCGYYHPKYSEIDRRQHLIFEYNKSLKKTIPNHVPNKHGNPDHSNTPIVERLRENRSCFLDLEKQLPREDIFKGRPTPHEKRFEFLSTNENWSRQPRTPSVQIEKQMARDQMMIYKKKHYAPDYQPNFEYGKKQLGSCGAAFDKVTKRTNLMLKTPAYNNEAYFEFDQYSRSPQSTLFRTPTAPNFNKMLDRECDGRSVLPSFMQKFTSGRMQLGFVHQKMLETNNFRDGRFQTVTSSFMPSNKHKKRRQKDESSDEEFEQDEQQ